MTRSRSRKMTAEEKVSKRRLDRINPVLWKQLDAASRGTKVNHLGRGHGRNREDE